MLPRDTYQCLERCDLSLELGDSGGLGSCHRDARTGLHLVCPATLAGGGDALDIFEKSAAAGM